MRSLILATALLVLTPAMLADASLTEGWLTSRTFLRCTESLDIRCAAFPETVTLRPDHSVVTGNGEPSGGWEILQPSAVRIGGRVFTLRSREGLFLAPFEEGLGIGVVLVENSRKGRRALKRREESHTPQMRRAFAHYLLRTAENVHDTCLLLIDAGDATSVDLLVSALPRRPMTEEAGVLCTYAHCAAALERITKRRCGAYREDWEQCLKGSK